MGIKLPIVSQVRKSEILLWSLISATYAAIIIQYSMRYGRLAAPPYYDDVSYFVDALPRLQEFYTRNWAVVCLGLLLRAPHSLFSTVVAVAGYLVFGTRDWAPYAANAVIILGLAGILNFLAQGLALWIRLLLFAIVATTPICLHAVYDFRPDIASGLVTAAGAMLLLTQPLSNATWQRRVLAGVMFGLSMIMKTPTFPLTMGLMFVALTVSTLADFFLNGWGIAKRPFVKLWAQAIAPALAIMLPVYLANLKVILSYIYEPIFGSTSVMWATHMPMSQHLLYYLTASTGGAIFLGWHLYLFVAILITGIVVIVRQGDFRLLILLGGMCVVTLAAYTVVTLVHVKQQFFGSTFDWMLILTTVQLLIWFARRATPTRRAIGIITVATLALGTLQPIPRMYTPEGGNLLARRRIIYAISDAINAEHPKPRDRIFITTTGFVNAHVIKYLNLQKCLPELNVGDLAFSDDLAKFRTEISLAQFVIASEPGNSEAFHDYIASGNVQAETLALVRQDTDLAQIAEIPTETPKRYFVFKRVGPGYGFEPIEGLNPIEGPFPKWKMGYVRWGLGPRTLMMTPPVPTSGHYHLTAETRGIAGQHMDFIIDGKFKYTQIFTNSVDFVPLDLALDLTPGRHKVEFDYSTWRTPANDLPMAVLFRTLKLLPDAGTTQPR
jgi:hypothetical protein